MDDIPTLQIWELQSAQGIVCSTLQALNKLVISGMGGEVIQLLKLVWYFPSFLVLGSLNGCHNICEFVLK